jgi:NADH dehydrogenase/NADH:ubiquinone oxidoreductase subunit G
MNAYIITDIVYDEDTKLNIIAVFKGERLMYVEHVMCPSRETAPFVSKEAKLRKDKSAYETEAKENLLSFKGNGAVISVGLHKNLPTKIKHKDGSLEDAGWDKQKYLTKTAFKELTQLTKKLTVHYLQPMINANEEIPILLQELVIADNVLMLFKLRSSKHYRAYMDKLEALSSGFNSHADREIFIRRSVYKQLQEDKDVEEAGVETILE